MSAVIIQLDNSLEDDCIDNNAVKNDRSYYRGNLFYKTSKFSQNKRFKSE